MCMFRLLSCYVGRRQAAAMGCDGAKREATSQLVSPRACDTHALNVEINVVDLALSLNVKILMGGGAHSSAVIGYSINSYYQ